MTAPAPIDKTRRFTSHSPRIPSTAVVSKFWSLEAWAPTLLRRRHDPLGQGGVPRQQAEDHPRARGDGSLRRFAVSP